MRTYLDCYPCFLRQALNAARRAGADEHQQASVVKRVLSLLQEISLDANPPDIAYRVHQIVSRTVAVDDPYQEAKEASTREALALYPRLKELLVRSEDRLDTAIRMSIAGNIIDFGYKDKLDDLWGTVEHVLQQAYAINHSAQLRAQLERVDRLLYLADNAGETVFDRVLIEELPLPVTYVVKGGPILNDATMEDALAAGLDTCAMLFSNGSQAPGTILPLCSDAFRQLYTAAPLIVAKGQANYETLSDAGAQVFCLLQVKCPVIALDVGVPAGSIVVRQSLISS